jgi:signal transduction histidine kinase
VKEDLEERLSFLAWSAEDDRLLADLVPLLDRHADRFVSAFYRHLLSFEGTRGLLRSPEVKDRLLRKQREYLLSLGTAPVDDAYGEERIRIGQVHERVGLEPRWYLGAYSLYFSLLAPLLMEALRSDPERAGRVVGSLMKRLMLDAQLALEAYITQHDEQMAHLNRELAATSRSLAQEHEATEIELRQTERRAKAAENLASVATLVAGLAHEIGTPMGVIRGHAEALEGAVQGEKAQWRVRTIREQIDRISTIIQSLLNVARPRQDVRVPVLLGGVADTAIAFLSEKLRVRGVQIERDYSRTPPVSGDPDKLQQLFLNLLLNAIDAMPDGGTLRVAIHARGKHVEVVVTDSGVGIAPGDLDNVFKPFFSTKPPGRGSGLGLVVAESIVADHQGQIEVSSALGHGTEFTILLPCVAQARSVPAPDGE